MSWLLSSEPCLIEPSYWRDHRDEDRADERLCVKRELDFAVDAVRAAYPEPVGRISVLDWVSDGWPAYNVEHPRDFCDGDPPHADWGSFFRALDDARLAFEDFVELEERFYWTT